jgi:phosphonate transport system substrate-binding protein
MTARLNSSFADVTTAEPAIGPASRGESGLVVVVARTPGGTGEWANFARVIGYLSEQIDRSVSVRYVAREEDAIDIVTADEADVAFLCAHMYLDLRDQGLVEGVAVPRVDGSAECSMQLVVRADDPRGFAELEGATLAVSDKSSLGGQAYLMWLCGEKGVGLQEYFGEVRTGEAMEENVAALLDGTVDATVVNSAQIARRFSEDLRVVEESPPFGLPPAVISRNLDSQTSRAISDALLGFDPSTLPESSRLDGFADIDGVSYEFEEALRDQCSTHGHIK